MKKVPRLRFRGFQEDWELCKLGDVANYRNGKAHEQVEDEDGKYTIINSKFISTNGKVQRYTNEQVEPIFDGEIAMVLSDLPNGKALAKLFLVKEDGKYTLNQRIAGITPKENINPIFLNFRMNRNSYFLKFDSGVTQTNLAKSQVENFVALYPTFDEQYKIGLFFTQLDNTITLHQRKLYQLKELKKAYLKAMFVSMNTKNNKVPKLRFTDFEGDWEHRKLDDSIKVMDGDRGANYPHDTDFFKDGDTLFLDTGNVTKNGFKFDSVKYITNEKDEQLRAGKLEKNDFVLTSRGTLGNVGFYDEVVYNLHPKIRINSAMLILRNTDEQLSYSYLHTLLKGQLISDFMKKNQVGSAQPHITKSEFLKLNLNVPCNINEQNKIGNFFKSLDVTITLHQNKLEQLKDLKTSYLQNMFI
ncbi:restriction endonuclease subunit S [Enterococcus faecalis]|nr:restriction endonuclease subunit S [Enterococcus faecalis]